MEEGDTKVEVDMEGIKVVVDINNNPVMVVDINSNPVMAVVMVCPPPLRSFFHRANLPFQVRVTNFCGCFVFTSNSALPILSPRSHALSPNLHIDSPFPHKL